MTESPGSPTIGSGVSGTGIPEPCFPEQPWLSPWHTRWLLLGLALATGMEFYTFDSMNLVLVDITGTLGVSADEASWVLTAYSSALFLGVPASVWLARHFGFKRYLLASIVLFAVSCAGCALAPDLQVMIFWRAVQGLAGAGLVIWWRAAIYLLMPRAQRSSSLMNVALGLFLASAIGLLVSGWVTDHFNWRLIFLPDLALAAVAFCILSKAFPALPPDPSPRAANTDWPGLILLALWTVSLQIILSRGPIDDWLGSTWLRVHTWVSLVSFIGFVFWQLDAKNRFPLLDVKLLANRNALASAIIGVCTGMILSGSLFVLPEFLRNTDSQAHDATATGRLICLYAFAAATLRWFASRFIARVGPRFAVGCGLGALVLSMLILSRWLTVGTPDTCYVLPLLLYGVCLALVLPAVGFGTVARIEKSHLLDGVTLYMTFRQFGASLGVALLTVVLERRETLHSARLFEHLRQSGIRTQSWLAEVHGRLTAHLGGNLTGSSHVSLQLLRETGVRQVTTLGYADAFLFMAFVGLVAFCFMPLIPAIAPPAPATQPPGHSK